MGTRIEELTPAFSIHPGEMILDEIMANGYSQSEFAKKLGMNRSQLNEIIKGKRDVNAELATLLEAALGLPAKYWLNLQNQYDIDKVKIEEKAAKQVDAIKEFDAISQFVAVKYLKKQSIICGDPVDDLPNIYNVYGVHNQQELIAEYNNPQYARFRKSEKLNIDKTNLIGWVKYSEFTAKRVDVSTFKDDSWESLKRELRKVIYDNRDVHERARNILGTYGIKLLYQPKAEKVPVDGIAFWSDENPTISMTLRHKRLDNFAFTLFHELGHVFLHLLGDRDKEIIDLFKNDEKFKTSKEEIEANDFASDNLIPKDDWSSFMANESITEEMVYDFADKVGINASIILGRICFEIGRYNIKTSISHQIN
ncbi:HigA family addiction module antitoxin [Crocinitomix algicola]|uniref:HigA family addiction module antitoxin n=1 Tax=Crocinitomix algicola TaxID=1740263 RepID=UPI0008726199|nr:HigA family addiction module antitoxin [Crocinitomix algicola]